MQWYKSIPILGRAVILFVVCFLSLILLFAPRPHPVDMHTASFGMTSSARLYFHNVRSYYYDIKPHEASRFVLYHLKRRERDTNVVCLQFTIVENTSGEEAFIYIELQDAGKQYQKPHVLISTKSLDSTVTEPLYNLNNEGHYQLAAAIWKALLEDQDFYLLDDRDTVGPLLQTHRARKNAEIVLEDYFKLIGKL